jgi:CBS domain-containing protein
MKVMDVCTRKVKVCRPDSDLAAAAQIMWDFDCGAVPVLDARDRLIGVITDRDICIAVATRKRLASEIPVKEIMSGTVVSCRLGDTLKEALRIMREAQIRRLPVLDEEGNLKGILAANDLILAIRDSKNKAEREALLPEVMMTLMSISQHRQPKREELAEIRAMVPGA